MLKRQKRPDYSKLKPKKKPEDSGKRLIGKLRRKQLQKKPFASKS